MTMKITIGVYRRLDNRFEGLSDDSPRGWELHNRRKNALHEIFDNQDSIQNIEWGATDDTERTHEYAEIVVSVVGPFIFQYVVVPGLKSLGEKLAENFIDETTSEFVKWLFSTIGIKQKNKEIDDFDIRLSDGTLIRCNSPDKKAEINIIWPNGKVENIVYKNVKE